MIGLVAGLLLVYGVSIIRSPDKPPREQDSGLRLTWLLGDEDLVYLEDTSRTPGVRVIDGEELYSSDWLNEAEAG